MKFVLPIFCFFVLVFPFFTHAAARIPNDPLYAEQWYLSQIKAPEAWDVTTGSREVVVAVIDSGVDEDHEDLVDNLWVNEDEIPGNGIDDDRNGYVDDRNGWDFLLDEPSPNPKFQSANEVARRPLALHHGTIVSGLIGARGNNAKGIAGVSWTTRIMALRALTSSGRGEIAPIVRAIDYAVANGASVINLSFDTGITSTLLTATLRRAHKAGVVIVAAAGNDSEDGSGRDLDREPLYPICAEGGEYVIGVAGTDRMDKKAAQSHFGTRCVDLAAPGVDIVSTIVRGVQFDLLARYRGGWSGTSFATALVSGAAALLRSIDPTLSPDAVRRFLQEGADTLRGVDTVYGERLGSGRLNIARSVALLREEHSRARILAATEQQAKRETRLAFAHTNGRQPTTITLTTSEGSRLGSWLPFAPAYRGKLVLISRDSDGDAHDEIIVAGGEGGGPHVRIFNSDGSMRGQFFAYESSYRGGMSVDIGDPSPDGKKEIVVFPGGARRGEARVFSSAGEQLLTFSPFGDNESGGGEIRIGDVTGDAIDDLVFVTKRSADPLVRVTNVFGTELFSFHPYREDVGDVSLALADVDGNGVMEIVTARGQGIPEVRVWKKDVLVANFLAYAQSFRGGVVVAGGDVTGDGRDAIVVVPRSNGGPHVKIFSGEGLLLRQFFTAKKSWRGGMVAAVVRE